MRTSMDHFEYRNGSLFCEDVPVADIAAEAGTPAYIYSSATLLHHYRAFVEGFADLSPVICFSIKSLSNLSVLKLLAAGGHVERAKIWQRSSSPALRQLAFLQFWPVLHLRNP